MSFGTGLILMYLAGLLIGGLAGWFLACDSYRRKLAKAALAHQEWQRMQQEQQEWQQYNYYYSNRTSTWTN